MYSLQHSPRLNSACLRALDAGEVAYNSAWGDGSGPGAEEAGRGGREERERERWSKREREGWGREEEAAVVFLP